MKNFSNNKTDTSGTLNLLKGYLNECEAVIIGAGAGLSTAAGHTYSGERFKEHFSDFESKYGFHDMYTGGFYPFETSEEFWAYWSRAIYLNRYACEPGKPYNDLKKIVADKEYFVLTTNVDHLFQKSGFDKERLFYTQGDYGLFQCSLPCHDSTYDNEEAVREMVLRQRDMRIPTELIPRCPECGREMTTNLRIDDKFVEDEGWHAAYGRYRDFLKKYDGRKVLFLELGVGYNTPGIIKYPFMRMTALNPNAHYISINSDDGYIPAGIGNRALHIKADLGDALGFCAG